MKHSIKIIPIIPIVLLLTFCNKEEKRDGLVPLEIEVDSAQIGTLYIDKDYGIEFAPPFLWEDYQTESSKRVESVKGSNKALSKKYVFESRYVFFDYGKNSILNVGEVKNVDSVSTDKLSIADYIDIFTSKYDPKDVTFVKYLKGDLILFHVLYKLQSLESYKYIFMNKQGRIIQFDYTIREQNREAEMPRMLSSLGTLHLIN